VRMEGSTNRSEEEVSMLTRICRLGAEVPSERWNAECGTAAAALGTWSFENSRGRHAASIGNILTFRRQQRLGITVASVKRAVAGGG